MSADPSLITHAHRLAGKVGKKQSWKTVYGGLSYSSVAWHSNTHPIVVVTNHKSHPANIMYHNVLPSDGDLWAVITTSFGNAAPPSMFQ